MNNKTTINTLDPNRIPEHIAIIMRLMQPRGARTSSSLPWP